MSAPSSSPSATTHPDATARRRRVPLRTAAVAIAGALAVVGGGCASSGSDRQLPDLTLPRLDQPGELALADLRGTPAVVNLWASWCAPCRTGLPAFDAVDRATDDDAVRFVGVDVGDERADAERFVAEVPVGFAQYHDFDGDLPVAMEASGMPVTVFVDADGNVVEVHTGALDRGELEDRLAEHFGVRPSTP